MRKLAAHLSSVLLVGAIACTDLSSEPERVPTRLAIDDSLVTVTAGEAVPLHVTVFDQEGQPISRPAWATPTWSTSDAGVISVAGTSLEAAGPGRASATASVAGLSASAVVRVNPTEIRLSVDRVEFEQGGSPADVLVSEEKLLLRVFLTADRPNFFRPTIRVRVRRGEEILATLDKVSGSESIPRTATPSNALEVIVPGPLVRNGNSVEILPDPEGELPHAVGSQRGYPETGTLPMRFALRIMLEGAYLTQSTQSFDGSVPLVAGRDALLRVFATSDEDIATRPATRMTLYKGGDPLRTMEVQRGASSFPRNIEEGSLGSSWNFRIPGPLLQPGVSLVVEADAAGNIPRKQGSSPRFPSEGALSLDVRAVPPLRIRMIPIHQTAFGTTGNIGPHNIAEFLRPTYGQFPLDRLDVDMRSVYSTDARLDTEDGWPRLLREIAALRIADGSSRYYYGVHTNPPGAIWGGMGYIGWPAAIGHDGQGSGGETMAHEFGHNFGLFHAPCGSVANTDPDFPYRDGGIGAFGYDLSAGVLKEPAVEKDLMTYCSPTWISDYNYRKVMAFRDRWDRAPLSDIAAVEPGVLVWGGLEAGRLVLEPSFELAMRPDVPTGDGPYRIEGRDDLGALIFSFDFDPPVVDHTGAKAFSFAIPARIALPARLARLRLTGPEGTVERVRRLEPGGPSVSSAREDEAVTLSWRADDFPMALVRDTETGEILSFARSGRARVRSGASNLEIVLSDGVGSVRRSIRIP